jgi:hypothetical protein
VEEDDADGTSEARSSSSSARTWPTRTAADRKAEVTADEMRILGYKGGRQHTSTIWLSRIEVGQELDGEGADAAGQRERAAFLKNRFEKDTLAVDIQKLHPCISSFPAGRDLSIVLIQIRLGYGEFRTICRV